MYKTDELLRTEMEACHQYMCDQQAAEDAALEAWCKKPTKEEEKRAQNIEEREYIKQTFNEMINIDFTVDEICSFMLIEVGFEESLIMDVIKSEIYVIEYNYNLCDDDDELPF